MKNLFLSILLATTIVRPTFADNANPRVAVFDTVFSGLTTSDDGLKSAMREIIISTIIRSGQYNIVERSLLEKIMQEQQFSNSGVVNESDAVEIGKLTGASKIVLSLISSTSAKGFMKSQKNILSIKIIDVKTANIENQKTEVVTLSNCLQYAESLTEKLLGHEQAPQQTVNAASVKNNVRATSTDNEFILYLQPQQIQNESHVDNYIKVMLDGHVIGGGTFSKGFEIKIKEKKHRKYKLEIHPTSISDKGKTNEKIGMTKYIIDTHLQQSFEFMLQSQYKKPWTIYSVLRM